jgi:solute carrier family 35 protein C2
MDTFSNKSRQSPRPTIPYSQIRRPTPKLQTTFERQKGHDELDPESAGSRVSYDLAMETSPNGRHRRRRSSANGGGVGEARTSTSSLRDPDDFTDDDLDDDEETGLTQPLRDERSQRKARATHLDQRISPSLSGADGDGAITSEEKAEARASMVKRLAINGLLIGLWYLFSLSISIYNTWMFGHAHLDFKFPLFTTSVHMLVQFSLASLVLYLFPRFRPRHDAISNPEGYRPVGDGLDGEEEEEVLRTRTAEEKKPLMTRWFYLTRLGPCGMATGLDIGLGNTSLKFISLSFYSTSLVSLTSHAHPYPHPHPTREAN